MLSFHRCVQDKNSPLGGKSTIGMGQSLVLVWGQGASTSKKHFAFCVRGNREGRKGVNWGRFGVQLRQSTRFRQDEQFSIYAV